MSGRRSRRLRRLRRSVLVRRLVAEAALVRVLVEANARLAADRHQDNA